MRLLLLLLFSVSVHAQTSTPPVIQTQAACPPCEQPEQRKDTAYYRNDSFGQLMLGYQYLDSWVIGKTTASYTQILSRGWSVEVEYGTSTKDVELFNVDFGEITDQRLALLGKFYIGNSFHVSFGPYANRIDIRTQGKLEDRFGEPFNDRLLFTSYGLSLGFGNRWQTSWGLTYGVDWIRTNAPLIIGETKERLVELGDRDKERVDRLFEVIRRIPTFTFVGVSIGYTF